MEPRTSRFVEYLRLMRLDRPIGIFLLLWPTLWGLWVAAEGVPDPDVLAIFVLGVILMRSAGCVINDFADRNLDGHVERTRERPLATGRVRPGEALGLFAVLCASAFVLVLFTNLYTILLSLGAVGLAVIYPFMKRYTYLPQVVLGAAFAWAIPMGFAAQTGSVAPIAWLIYTATVVWTVAYDTMYAMVDRDDDLRVGIRSTAILFGDADRIMVALLQATTLFCLVLVGGRLGLSQPYYMSLWVAGGFFLYQQWLIRRRRRDGCFQAFLNNNWVGLTVFLGLFLHYLEV